MPPLVGQPKPRVFRVGNLQLGSDVPPVAGGITDAFLQELRNIGYTEGQNLVLDWRYADGRPERLPELAAELVRLGVDVIVAGNEVTARAANQATRTVPIVFGGVADPVGAGYVVSLSRPGGNMTGLIYIPPEASTKRLELLKEIAPGISRVAILTGPINFAQPLMELAGPALGVQLQFLRVRDRAEFDAAIDAMVSAGAEAVLASSEGIISEQRARLIGLAAQRRWPAIYAARSFVDDGGLMSYAPNNPELGRRTAALVDRILKGARPTELPVEQATKFDLFVNLRTARDLGLAIPPSVMTLATEIIQ